jgi:EAL domain-containing protein (putative c-di-GMP-specific phosphodiesterase class I)
MNAAAEQQIELDDVIAVDEVGIESGGYGIYRLRSLYQPIFERQDQVLQVVAVEGTVAPYVAGEEVPAEVFETAVTEDDRDFVEQMGLALPLRNHRNIGIDKLDLDKLELVLGPEGSDPETLVDHIRLIAREVVRAGLDPGLVACAFGEQAASDGALLSRLAEEMRNDGLRIAVGDFGAGHWTDEAIDLLGPEIVRIDGKWFSQVCRDAATVKLFDAVVSRLRERGSKVLVTGIGDERQFGVALRSGAELFQGPHLAPPALVGTVFEDAPLSIAKKLGGGQKIVPLFG